MIPKDDFQANTRQVGKKKFHLKALPMIPKYPVNHDSVDSIKIILKLREQITPFATKFDLNDKLPSGFMGQFKTLWDKLPEAPTSRSDTLSIMRTSIFNCFHPITKDIRTYVHYDDVEDVDGFFVEVYKTVRRGIPQRLSGKWRSMTFQALESILQGNKSKPYEGKTLAPLVGSEWEKVLELFIDAYNWNLSAKSFVLSVDLRAEFNSQDPKSGMTPTLWASRWSLDENKSKEWQENIGGEGYDRPSDAQSISSGGDECYSDYHEEDELRKELAALHMHLPSADQIEPIDVVREFRSINNAVRLLCHHLTKSCRVVLVAKLDSKLRSIISEQLCKFVFNCFHPIMKQKHPLIDLSFSKIYKTIRDKGPQHLSGKWRSMSFLALESRWELQKERNWKDKVAGLIVSEWKNDPDAQKVYTASDPQTKAMIIALLSDAYEWHHKVKSRVLYLDFEPMPNVSDVKLEGLRLKSCTSSGNGLVYKDC